MGMNYAEYQPMLLENVTLATLKSAEYRRFICDAAIASGVRLVVARSRLNPDWPYIDTKFNPNTGADLPADSYNAVFTWFLGRGSQALDGHLPWIDRLDDLSADEKREAKDLFTRLIGRMTDDIFVLTEKNNGRCPFRANRDLEGIDENGNRIESDPDTSSGGDMFCAKGLIASGEDAKVRKGVEMLLHAADLIQNGRYYGSDKEIGQGAKMLFQDTVSLVYLKTEDAELRRRIADAAAELMTVVLDKHYAAETAVFSEYINRETEARGTYLDPGHAAEFVGLGLGATATVRADAANLTDARRALIARAGREMPRLLIKDIEFGFNPKFEGLFKAVDTAGGEVLNDGMPWWNLPEAMRAAALAYEVAADDAQRQTLLAILAKCHNAYFGFYPNREKMLFPFQTISGVTGEVVDVVPAVPEGDPLYHTNLALLEMLDVIERL